MHTFVTGSATSSSAQPIGAAGSSLAPVTAGPGTSIGVGTAWQDHR
jgi:hypothetical protein